MKVRWIRRKQDQGPQTNQVSAGKAEMGRVAFSGHNRTDLLKRCANWLYCYQCGSRHGPSGLRRSGWRGTGGTAVKWPAVATFGTPNLVGLGRAICTRDSGAQAANAIAVQLSQRDMPARQGGQWHVSNVRDLLVRVDR